MRTGAIFARGSCRALKWVALFGVVFMLGGGESLAQAPAVSSSAFVPGTKIVTITMDQAVTGSPSIAATATAEGFWITGAGTGNAIQSVDVGSGPRRANIVLNLKNNIESGSDVMVTYTAPTEADDPNHIKALDDETAVDDLTAFAIGETDVIPSLTKPKDMTVVVNERITAIPLDEAEGGNGDLTYTLRLVSSSAVPALTPGQITNTVDAGTGLRFLANPPTILGTPSVVGEHSLRLTVADELITGGRVSEDTTGDSVPVDFKITVESEGFTPTDDVEIEAKKVTAASSVAEGGSLEVTVTAEVSAGDGKATRTVAVSFPTTSSKIETGEEAEGLAHSHPDFELLGATGGAYTWKDIPIKEDKSEATFKFRVEIRRDLDAENEKFQIEVQIGSTDAVKTEGVLMIDDAQTQKYTLSLPSAAKGAITEGADDATKLTLKADPARTMNIPVSLAVNPNDPTKYSLSALSASEFGMDPTAVTATIKAMADKNRTEDTITVTAYTGGTLGNNTELASLDITVKDANPLPGVRATLVDEEGEALDPQPMSVTEGETLMVMLTALDEDGDSMEAAEDLSVSLMAAGTAGVQDYRLSANPIEIASGKKSSAAVDLMVLADNEVDDGEILTFDAVVSGDEKVGPGSSTVMGVLTLMVEDGTMKLVWAKTQEEVEAAVYAAKEAGAGADEIFAPGEMMEVMGSALFSAAEGVTLSYTASTDADAVKTSTSGGMVTVTAMEAGMAHVTITAHATAPAGVKILPQGEPDEASILFPVEVGLEALSIMLSGPEDMNIAEGGMGAMVTATTNRAVTEDVAVMLMGDRAMSSADDMDYMLDPEMITIMAGEMMGSTMVTAVEDMEAEDMEELVLYGMTEGMAGAVTGEVKLYIWDAAVPALPIIAQLLLAAFLTVGGYRRYRRR